MDELFDIVGYEGLYKINKNGDVWSCRGRKFLKHLDFKKGYYKVNLYKTNIDWDCYFIHRLLAINFIPNPDNLPEIDHIDRNPSNNNLENLRWSSRSANCCNKTKAYNNQSGYKNIHTAYHQGRSYWKIKINILDFRYEKIYNKNKYTLEEVVAFRNEKLLELGLPIFD
jgi:hypothetical protein